MAIDTNMRNVRMIQSVTGAAFSVEQNRNPALELCSMCGRCEACEAFGRMMGYEHRNPVRMTPRRRSTSKDNSLAGPAGCIRSAKDFSKR